MADFNKIRNGYRDEIEELKPLLRSAYQSIYEYQLHRNAGNEANMREAVARTAEVLSKFTPHIPGSKAKYIHALKRQRDMSPFDLIICFDQAVYELHFWTILKELGIKKGQWSRKYPWSKQLRTILDERQLTGHEHGIPAAARGEEWFKTSGIPASRGTAQGPACIVRDQRDFHRIRTGAILVTAMTTPDVLQVANLIAGIVTDRGGVVCHAAIWAREFGLPCIVGCRDATTTITDGEMIRMDAISGVVMGVRM